MKATHKRALYSAAATTALLIGSVAMTPGTASASENTPQSHCAGEIFYEAHTIGGASYAPRGPVVGKKNSSSHSSTLTLAVTTTQSRSSTWEGDAGGSVGWGIAQIEAHTSYSATKSVASGVTVTDTMTVDAGKRGFMQPTALYRTFQIEKWRENGNCTTERLNVYQMKAIVSPLFFTECQTAGASCTPKP